MDPVSEFIFKKVLQDGIFRGLRQCNLSPNLQAQSATQPNQERGSRQGQKKQTLVGSLQTERRGGASHLRQARRLLQTLEAETVYFGVQLLYP